MTNFNESLAGFLQKRLKGKIWRLSKEAALRQWFTNEKLQEISLARLKSLLVHAQSTVPYYRDHFEMNGINLESDNFAEEYAKISLLDKDILRAQHENLVTTNRGKHSAKENASGGSTGKPVSFLTDMQVYEAMFAQMNVFFSWAGWRPGETMFWFWGGGEPKNGFDWQSKIKRSITRQHVFPVYSYDEKSFMDWWDKFQKYKPKLIYAYPSVLANFSSWLLDKGFAYQGLKGIFSSAEVLHVHQREIIEEAFGCKVYNQYGCREAPAIACECPEGNMHLMIDLNYVEFVDVPGSDGLKEIVVTPLFNYAQPLIRYNLMDCGRPVEGSCPCGRGYPLMAMEIGRHNDHIRTASGLWVFPSFFLHLLDGEGWIKNYQFCQKQIDYLELTIEPETPTMDDSNIKNLATRISPIIKEKMGNDIELKIIPVDTIPRNRSGKHRFVITEISN